MEHKEYRLAAIMYTDIAGFSRMLEKNESGTLETLGRHNRLITESVAAQGGRVIKSVGDVFLSEFPNTVDAVRSAIDVQNAIAKHNETNPERPFYVRVGIHLGDIYFIDDDALGEGGEHCQSTSEPRDTGQNMHFARRVELGVDKIGPECSPAWAIKVKKHHPGNRNLRDRGR